MTMCVSTISNPMGALQTFHNFGAKSRKRNILERVDVSKKNTRFVSKDRKTRNNKVLATAREICSRLNFLLFFFIEIAKTFRDTKPHQRK